MMQQAGGMDTTAMMQRVRRLVMLDTTVFDEVKSDAASTLPAVIIAVVSTLLFGLGGWLWYQFQDYNYKGGQFFLYSAILGTIVSLILLGAAIFVTYVMLTQVFRARADLNELVRVVGFATAPLAIGILIFIPGFDLGIGVLAIAGFFGASYIAVQSATDAPSGKALVATAAGFAVWALVLSLIVQGDAWKTVAPNIFVFAPR
jgi:hypothetical protein